MHLLSLNPTVMRQNHLLLAVPAVGEMTVYLLIYHNSLVYIMECLIFSKGKLLKKGIKRVAYYSN